MPDSSATEPKPIPIIASVTTGSEQKFAINEEGLEKVLLHPKCANKKVCIVSVAGAYRGGKSFILNTFLRYLNWKIKGNKEGGGDWLADGGPPLGGFTWRASSKAVTDGILMWSEPFMVENEDGEQIAIILMDTQGIFDNKGTVNISTTIFALSTLISSVQVYNIKGGSIQMDQLQHLQMFSEYARMAMENNDTGTKPFQKLLFLVRDWPNSDEFGYGLDGGKQLLDDDVLKIDQALPKEQYELRKSIRQSFASLDCFLMPYPGEAVTEPRFDGQIKHVSDKFKVQLRPLVSHLFVKPLAKTIIGQPVTGRELLLYTQNYLKVFNSGHLPQPMSVMNAMAESFYTVAIGKAKAIYVEEMDKKCGANTPSMLPGILLEEHKRCMDKAMSSFDKLRKFGGMELVGKFRAKLQKEIEAKRIEYERSNEGKRREEENRRQEEANRRQAEENRRQEEANSQAESDRIYANYARTLPALDSIGHIRLRNGHKYTLILDFFLRYGAAHCRAFHIWGGPGYGFVDYPIDFFNDLIKYCYETKVPTKAIRYLNISLPSTSPAPWPAALVQPQAGEMDVEEVKVNNNLKRVHYILRNKHNPDIAFKLLIQFLGGGKCYEQMTVFEMLRV